MSGDLRVWRGRMLACGIATLVGLTGCGWIQRPNLTTATLEQSLPMMEEWAKDWRADAQLWFVSFKLLPGDETLVQQFHTSGRPFKTEPSQREVVTGFYLSPSDFSEALIISIRRDGSMVWETDTMRNPPSVFVPIGAGDWEVDSFEAFKVAQTREGNRFLIENEVSQCSQMTLRREDYEPNQPIVWDIQLETCGLLDSEYFQRTHVDAMTGEILSQNTYEISPFNSSE